MGSENLYWNVSLFISHGDTESSTPFTIYETALIHIFALDTLWKVVMLELVIKAVMSSTALLYPSPEDPHEKSDSVRHEEFNLLI
jgi:hypothetical protein